MDLNEEFIPQLDLNEWFHGDEPTKTKFAQKWNQAFCGSGFCTVINHGVPATVINSLYTAGKSFFDLPLQEKSKYTSGAREGYYSRGTINFDATGESDSYDHHNFFQFEYKTGVILPTGDLVPPVLLEPHQNYWSHLTRLASVIHDICDRALGLPSGTMAKMHTDSFVRELRLADYYSLSQEECSSSAKRLGAHSDYMSFTILKCDEVSGLEVAYNQHSWGPPNFLPQFEKWVPVNPAKDAFVINAGDFMSYWTNGYWKSNFHQVVTRPERRMSMVFFTGPAITARTDYRLPCEVCQGPDKYPTMKMSLEEYFSFRDDKGYKTKK